MMQPVIVDERTVRGFADEFAGEVILPTDPSYDAARVVWNGMIDRRPAMVVRPTGAGDVISAVRFARAEELPIAVRSGGHSIPGFSTCDDGIVLDLSRMRGVRVDPERRTAHVSGGSLLGDLDHEAQAFGLVCPVGVISHTGAAGLTLGGGMGRLQRKFGLTIDNLLSADVVTADGRLVHASEAENADLLWGLRGAGANFGIATSLEYRLHPLDRVITQGSVLHPVDRAVELAALFREAVEHGPDELWAGFGLGLARPADRFPPELAGRPVAFVNALHCGSLQDAERDLAKLRAFGPPVAGSIEPKPYLATQTMNDEAMRWGHRFYMKSAFLRDLPDEVVDLLVGHLSRIPEGAEGEFTAWAMGGAIGAVPDEATAYTGRDASFWLAAEILWDDESLDSRCREWARGALADVQPFATTGRYVNDVAEAGDDVVRSVYGDAKYEKLVDLKRAWDPDNVFHLNQNVPP
jgi:FAD binding domain/Berberine and berberine like